MPNISFVLYMFICLLLTIIIELLVAYILKVNNKMDLLNILLVNILTNPIVVSTTNLISINYGSTIGYIYLYTLELIVVFIEGFIYKKYLNYKKINPYILSLILNVSSYLGGLIINTII